MDFKGMIVPGVGTGLVVGFLLGVIGVIPIVNLINLGCCLWLTAGGFIAAFWYGRNKKIELADGAVVGAIFGLTQGIVSTIVGLVGTMVFGMLGMGIAMAGGRGAGGALAGMGLQAVTGVMLGIFSVFIAIVFGAVGGLIYAATMGKK